jgi:hypothetical protein
MTDNKIISSLEEKLEEYYILVDQISFDLYRIPADDFDKMFESIDGQGHTYQLNSYSKERDNAYCCLDSYMGSCQLNNVRSDWEIGNESFKVKGIYYMHNNI